MALLTPVAGNVLQTQINMLAWVLKAGRKANHAKLIDYYGTNKEDIYEQYKNVTRTMDANRWQDGRIHVLVEAHLKGVIVDFYEENKGTFT